MRYLKIIKNCRNSILKLKVYVQDFITHPSAQCRRICQNKSLWQFKNIMYLRSLAVGNALSIKGRQYTLSREKCRLHFFISVISIKSIIKMKKSLHFFHLIFFNSTFSKLVCHSTSEYSVEHYSFVSTEATSQKLKNKRDNTLWLVLVGLC